MTISKVTSNCADSSQHDLAGFNWFSNWVHCNWSVFLCAFVLSALLPLGRALWLRSLFAAGTTDMGSLGKLENASQLSVLCGSGQNPCGQILGLPVCTTSTQRTYRLRISHNKGLFPLNGLMSNRRLDGTQLVFATC